MIGERVRAAYRRIDQVDRPEIWIDLRPEDEVLAEAAAVAERFAAGEPLPLYGRLAAVKGNIDVAGLPTTAGCPAYAYRPARDATSVARLRAAGALILGTTNLDQFATGLVGTRSPYGAVRNAVDPAYISGGSSSGSAVAVALGIADVALGTDTAGSGRVPAALNGIVGLKPTPGLVPICGVVPACRSIDCVSIFARTVAEAELTLRCVAGSRPTGGDGPEAGAAGSPDPLGNDSTKATAAAPERPPHHSPDPGHAGRNSPFRIGTPGPLGPLDNDSTAAPGQPPHHSAGPWHTAGSSPFRIGIPGSLGPLDDGWTEAFAAAVADYAATGAEVSTVDLTPFLAAARLLYEGSFVAERYTAVGEFLEKHRGEVDPTVAAVITAARDLPAHRVFADLATLATLKREAGTTLSTVDALLLPTTTGHPTLAEVAADPVGVNTALGRFTNFANLLGLSALAVPAGTVRGLPFGVMFVGPPQADGKLAALARTVEEQVRVAVFGAHLRGQPLNHELTSRGGRFVAATTTAAGYRLHALATTPPKPGLVRVSEGGVAIAAEVWELPVSGFGSFVAGVAAPLTIGRVRLADGSEVCGFLCEPAALAGAPDISAKGGWLAR